MIGIYEIHNIAEAVGVQVENHLVHCQRSRGQRRGEEIMVSLGYGGGLKEGA